MKQSKQVIISVYCCFEINQTYLLEYLKCVITSYSIHYTKLYEKDEVLRGLNEGIFTQREDQSVWADLTPEGLDQKLLLRSDGTSVYMTQDIGTAKLRFNDYEIDKMVYVVGNEQDYHFKVLSILLDKLGFSWGKGLHHFSYGMVELPHGKMKSREGTVVDADDFRITSYNVCYTKLLRYGPNAFSGAINIVTEPGDEESVKVDVAFSDHGLRDLNASGNVKTGKLTSFIAANNMASNGYINNTDFDTYNIFYQGRLKTTPGMLDFQAGYTDKGFGANSFYTPKYPNQYEATKTTFASVKMSTGEKLHFTPAAYWRRNQDRFELFRDNPASWYAGHNYHMTDA